MKISRYQLPRFILDLDELIDRQEKLVLNLEIHEDLCSTNLVKAQRDLDVLLKQRTVLFDDLIRLSKLKLNDS